MITVIEETENNMLDNCYANMTLAEACNRLEIDTIQSVNDFRMNILLSEHAYLYENGVEITYVDEAGNPNANGKSLKERCITWIKDMWKKIVDLWNKCIDWVKERVTQVINYVKKALISKKSVAAAQRAFKYIYGDKKGISVSLPYVVNYDTFHSKYQSFYDGSYKADSPIYDAYVQKAEKPETIYSKDFDYAVNFILYDAKSNIINDIKESRDTASDEIKDTIAALRQTTVNDEKGDSNDAISSTINEYLEQIKAFSYIARESIKVYHAQVTNQIAVIRGVLSDTEIKKAVTSELKDTAKVATGARKIAAEGRYAGNRVANAASKATGGVSNAAKATGRAFAKGANRVGKLFKTEKSVNLDLRSNDQKDADDAAKVVSNK